MSTAQDNFDKGVQLRLEGNEAFKKQEFKQALTHYYNALLHLKAVGGQKEEAKFKQQSTEQLIMIYNNMSNVFAKQERWDHDLVKKELAKIAEADKLMDQKEKSIYRAMMAKLAEEKK
ncbi:hypothetical protein [Parasitella parasitica]|uniref:MIT domain-containing protein n=1 Tax=Parasitella parasitica TaxID=35722 RepID=A0A0B7NDP9_9FUNG|nr:hypothetical protein [Parasitella parasitica]